MKKNILIIIAALGIQSFAQIDVKMTENVPMANSNEIIDITGPSALGGGDEVIWFEDFGDDTTPNIVTEDIAGYGDWHWSNESPGGQWSENAGVIQSETADNGFMIMEADFYNTAPQNDVLEGSVGENPVNANFTIGPIDLSMAETEELVLQFYSNYRICCYYSPSASNDLNVYISTDGGETFQDLNYIEGETFEVNVEKEVLSQIQLGNFSANTDNVYFRFEWIGTHYFWMIDDLSVITRPAYDLQMQSSWLTMEDPASIEYYAIPKSQMPDEMLIGAAIYNYGYNDDDCILTGSIDGTGITTEANIIVEADSISYLETDFFDIATLEAGTYNFTAAVSSYGDDSNMEDNMLSREFVISENIYAIDGLYSMSEWQGTGWPGGDDTADGVRYANYFDIKEETVLSSIEIILDTDEHPTSLGTFQTEAGGEIIAYVCDTTGIFNPLVETLDPDFGGAIWTSDFYLVTQDDVDDGRVVIDVDELPLSTDAYYVVVEFYSNGLTSDVLILDDTSVPQPWFASLIFYPSDQTWYSNPNASSIRIGLDGFEHSLSENTLKGIECFPNPTNDYIEISTENLLIGETNIIIYNILGEVIKQENYAQFENTQKINLDNLSSGSYILELENNAKISRHKLIIE